MELAQIEEILERLGLTSNYRGQNYVATSTEFRGGDNPTGLLCFSENLWDQIESKRYSWPQFVSKVKNISIKDAEKFLSGFHIDDGEVKVKEEKLKVERFLNEIDYSNTIPSYKFFLDRGIKKETLDYFGIEFAQSGPMYGRLIVKIRNKTGKLIGVAGREALNRPNSEKWINKGPKVEWVYPCFDKNIKAIQGTKQIILVESIGDMLSLCNSGIWQVLCLFGLSISPPKLAHIVSQNPNQIFLGLNDDSNKKDGVNRGQVAVEKLEKKLSVFFDSSKIIRAKPSKNDFGDQAINENLIWAEKFGVKYE